MGHHGPVWLLIKGRGAAERCSDNGPREAAMVEAILTKTGELRAAGVDNSKTRTEGDLLELS
jgi:hypothetical protein